MLELVTGGGEQDPVFNQPLLTPLLEAINRTGKGSAITMAVSFIRQSGLSLLQDALSEALGRGVELRVLTSDYLDVTEPVALRELMLLVERGADVRIYQSSGEAGFHLKSYLFIHQYTEQRLQGKGFVGSSNLSKAALTQSLEWSWQLTVNDDGHSPAATSLLALQAQMERLFNDSRVVVLSNEWIDDYLKRYRQSPLTHLRLVTGDTRSDDETLRETPMPNSVQASALAALQVSRTEGYRRGLVVMATGLGKTWLAAFDVRQMQAARILFVAHREEIIRQAQSTFIHMNPKAHIGLYTGKQKDQADWLFASVQTLGRDAHLRHFARDHFDYIVVDEFHHATASSYRRLLDHFQPRFLLGLTATPDRTDQADILALCDDNLVFECHLREAIELRHLVPLVYHGIYDEHINYEEIPWRNGRFDPDALEHAFASHKRARHALEQWRRLGRSRTLAFCVSVRHAEFMAQLFKDEGIKAAAVYAESSLPRNQALNDLAAGRLSVIFSVDLFNEGTDLPAIDTLLMLRPTESRIVFLQQLGRGLRLHPGKQDLMVIDLVGNHRSCLFKPWQLQQALGGSGTPGKTDITLPPGCFINLDPQLLKLADQLRYGSRVKVADDYCRLRDQLGARPTAVQAFQAGIDFTKLRKQHGSWFGLVHDQGDLTEDAEQVLEKLNDFLLTGIETTKLTKCFKLILLQALLELDGLRQPPLLTELAEQSRLVLERHPDLFMVDLAEPQQAMAADSAQWLSYWSKNPIKHSTGGNNDSQADYWFEIQEDRFCPRFILPVNERDTLHDMMQELVDLRLAEYRRRKIQFQSFQKTAIPPQAIPDADVVELPFYPDLKIACGHFRTGSSDQADMMAVPGENISVDSQRYFLARASGHSMNGGKNPVNDGDLLLLEWITPDTAGSISNQTLAIERQDETGDDQYLLRVVSKTADGSYLLHATNPDYEDIPVTDEMKPFARLRSVLKG
ncbi:DEAD-box ATP dependent DNA helicase [Oceanimonas sp. GK1]|uniref:DEAD/DEAH box helicase family protein n=1 Tax=Oceanimonas sp. (strain GK1 / IBRC-M 10197) TaxID=511062 RepID=UPI0002495158|nr:DEAD/DEAH box helicase family protein [Oceanimonas sp. GK1]AEY00886.1 DEAD-box ATP dependent DNA helicase [Oceanimonas sp. GK1]